jgi:alkanesulfonate monooxygenase SsuD/methylene tetrahydromethanopterin reductase-like flavin-dependent oxidoreductase (luciferase family)
MIEGQEGVTWEHWVALAEACEAAGLEGLFRSDHYLSIVRGGEAGSLDAWTTIAALAARTERIRLGTLVSPVTFRPPAVLAKAVVTAQEISGGRVELGMGAGWYAAEHDAYGFPFPPVGERMDELERQLEVVTRHWDADGHVWPKPSPRPRLVVGGSAKPRTVRAAVRYADEYNTTFATPEECRERRERVDEAASAAGREPLTFSLMTGAIVGRDDAELDDRVARFQEIRGRPGDTPHVTGTFEQVVERLGEYERAGVERIMLQHLDHEDVDMVDVLGELARAVA